MLKIIFLILSLLILLYISMRKLDFFSIGAVCFILYHSHCIIGEVAIQSLESVHIQLYAAKLDPILYYIIFLQLIFILFAMIIYDSYKRNWHLELKNVRVSKRNANDSGIHKTFVYLGILSLLLFLFDIFHIGLQNLTKDKGEVWDKIGIFYIFSLWSALAVFTYSVKAKKYSLLFLSLPPVLTHLFIGSRAYFAALVIVFLILYRDNLGNTRLSNIKTYILGLVGFFVIMVYKSIYKYIKNFDFASVMAVLSDKETYMSVLRLGEPRIVLANYNYIISTHFRLDSSDIIGRFISVIPFANSLVEPTHGLHLSKVFISDFNATYGLASNFWAEGYAMFGYLGIFIFYIVWLLMLALGSDMIYSKKWSKYFAIPVISYFAFYIHRMDFVKAIGNLKYLLFAMIIWLLINSILNNYWKVKIIRFIKIPRLKKNGL
ncbi:MAG: O-antigen polysaccharide polymerase Wzy [Bacteroidota bacterium]